MKRQTVFIPSIIFLFTISCMVGPGWAQAETDEPQQIAAAEKEARHQGMERGKGMLQALQKAHPEIAERVKKAIKDGAPPRQVMRKVAARMKNSDRPGHKKIMQRLKQRRAEQIGKKMGSMECPRCGQPCEMGKPCLECAQKGKKVGPPRGFRGDGPPFGQGRFGNAGRPGFDPAVQAQLEWLREELRENERESKVIRGIIRSIMQEHKPGFKGPRPDGPPGRQNRGPRFGPRGKGMEEGFHPGMRQFGEEQERPGFRGWFKDKGDEPRGAFRGPRGEGRPDRPGFGERRGREFPPEFMEQARKFRRQMNQTENPEEKAQLRERFHRFMEEHTDFVPGMHKRGPKGDLDKEKPERRQHRDRERNEHRQRDRERDEN